MQNQKYSEFPLQWPAFGELPDLSLRFKCLYIYNTTWFACSNYTTATDIS